MTCPCHECMKRTAIPNCHSSCELYQAYSAERELIRSRRQCFNVGDSARIASAEKRQIEHFKSRRK